MIPQCKGKDLVKVPQSRLGYMYYASTKYDGHFVQIHKHGDNVKFYTSGGKLFYIEELAEAMQAYAGNFILDTEFICCDGKLGGRAQAAYLTTLRTEYNKGIVTVNLPREYSFKVIEVVDTLTPIHSRIAIAENILNTINHIQLSMVEHKLVTLEEAKTSLLSEVLAKGYEGLYLQAIDSYYSPDKRVNDRIKLKKRPTAEVKCYAIQYGEGKYDTKIGSLVCADAMGREVRVGSGLTDEDRGKDPMHFIGEIIEIEYERLDNTYIQPIYKGIRKDKDKAEEY